VILLLEWRHVELCRFLLKWIRAKTKERKWIRIGERRE
jgi:hypothetical protein